MWPFSKKNTEKKENIYEMFERQIMEIKEFRDIGEKFRYLGVEIIVTHHSERRPYQFTVVDTPVLKGDYINNKGDIKSISFGYSELEAIKAENKRKTRLDVLLNPRFWTKEMHDAWHSNIPDTMKAFEALRKCNMDDI